MGRPLWARLSRLSGNDVSPLGPGWMVQRADEERPLEARKLGVGGGWLVHRGRPRKALRIGGPDARTHLVLNDRAARREMARVQKDLSHYLAQEQVAWLLRELAVNVVLDVGANVGQYARGLRRSGYRGRIVSFEPVSALAAELRKAAADDPDWLVYDCALGDEETTTEINVARGPSRPALVSSLLPSSDFGKEWSEKLRDMDRETITVRRLDSVFDEAVSGVANPRVFLKMDTQGYDLRAFRGAGHVVDQLLGLQSEVSCVPIYEGMPHLTEQLAVYEAAGFAPAGMFQVSRHGRSMRIIEFDLMMVRADETSSAGCTA
jgi:FkbM family methyltransferase